MQRPFVPDDVRAPSGRGHAGRRPWRRALARIVDDGSPEVLSIVVLAGMVAIGNVLFVAATRIRFPYDIEWMEGGVLMQAERLGLGESIYPPPGATFVPFFYPPLYPGLLAVLGHLTGGVTYALARSVSFGSTVLGVGLGAMAIRRATRRPTLALLGAGLSAALATFAGSFYDLARPDTLAMALVMLGATLAFRGGTVNRVLAGLVLASACFAKQTAVACGIGVALGVLIVQGWRSATWLVSSAALLGLVAFAILERATGAGFSLYVLSGHQSHRFYVTNFTFFFFRDVLHLAPLLLLAPLVWLRRRMAKVHVPVLLALVLAAAVVHRAVATADLPHMYYRDLWYPRALWPVPPLAMATLLFAGTGKVDGEVSAPVRFWGAVFLGAVLASALGHSTQWAFKNALMPMAIVGVPFVVLVVDELLRTSPRAPLLVSAALLLQFVALYEVPLRRAPRERDRISWDALRTKLQAEPGKVMVLAHPRLAWELGGGEHLHQMGITDVASLGGVPDLEPRLARHEWSVIVTDEGDGITAPSILKRHYERAESLDVRRMKTGSLCHPAVIWRPRGKT